MKEIGLLGDLFDENTHLRGFVLLVDVVKDVRFIDEVKEMETHQQAKA